MPDFTVVDDLQLMTGIDIPVEGIGITIRQPTVKDISMLGETKYFIALQLFTMTKEELHIESPEVTNWFILNETLKQKIDGVRDTKTLILNFMQLFFKSKINFGPRSLILMTNEGITNIEPEDFDNIQYVIGRVGGKSLLVPAEKAYKPLNKRAAQIAEKMKKSQKKLAEVKAREGKAPEHTGEGFVARYMKTVAIGTSNSLEQINAMTLYQLNTLMQSYLSWEAYDIEVKSRLAGAKGDKDLVHWTMRDYEKDNSSIGRI